MIYADSLGDVERRRGRISAYAACWFGCISEVMLDSSAILILYLTMLNGSSTLTMLSTSLSGIILTFLMIPCAWMVDKIGLKRSVKYACLIGCSGYLLMGAAPWFGEHAAYVVFAGCFIYCLQRPFYGACWYPLLDNFLRPQDRGDFFGFMRFTYMIISGGLFLFLGLIMGKNPPAWLMQLTVAVTGLLLLGRWFFVNRFPVDPASRSGQYDLKQALKISIRNGPLVGYSVYACLLSVAYTSLLPLILIYLKMQVKLGANEIQIISTIGIAGSIVGFFCYGFLLRHFGMRSMQLGVHMTFFIAALLLFLIPPVIHHFDWVVSLLLFLISFAISCFLCNNSAEMMALACPGNKTMAVAFCQTYQNAGVAVSRGGTAFVLGTTMLTPSWSKWGLNFCSYQTFFLIYAAIAAVILILLPLLPAFVSKHEDYYAPGDWMK